MTKILRRRIADGRVRRLVEPPPTVTVILRRRTADGRVRRILRSGSGSAVAVSVITRSALESLVRQSGDGGVLFEWLEQANKVVADEVLSIEWSALPPPVQVSLERLLASPGKRRLNSTPGRLRLLKRP